MKARRIPFGLLYVASLVLLVILIPLIRFAGPHPSTAMHRQSSAMTLRLEKMKL